MRRRWAKARKWVAYSLSTYNQITPLRTTATQTKDLDYVPYGHTAYDLWFMA